MVEGFVWKEVTEKDKEEIKNQAKDILDDFSEKLSNIDLREEEGFIDRDLVDRIESSLGKCEIDRDIMFDNAPISNKDKGFIIGEKKKW